MKNFLRKTGYKFQSFMTGRYGIDELWKVLLIAYVVLIIISNIVYSFSKVSYYALAVMSFVILIYALYRVFSKNIGARRAENAAWIKFRVKISSWFKLQKEKFTQRKTHKFVKCKNCKKTLRLPRHKGKINVNCPHCKTQFTVNTGKKPKQ